MAKEKKPKKDNFFKSVKKEMSNVKWLNKKDMIKYTIATLVFCVFFAIYFYGINLLFAFIKGLFN